MRLYDPEQELPEPPIPCVPRKKHPRCRCGCGKAARWPQDGSPVFHTRLCGYLMALKMFRKKVK